jgi:hypothetical protein
MASAVSAALVHEAAVRDREQPSPEGGFIALESVQRACGVDPDLRGQVFGLRWGLRAKVPQESGLKIGIERAKRPLGTGLCRGEH